MTDAEKLAHPLRKLFKMSDQQFLLQYDTLVRGFEYVVKPKTKKGEEYGC